ncbi:MAG: DUF2029 domain-containing protein [Planctomycetes bacterium]|nr:DUF2029 domain-containing protein [Planctomycetota bacterium]
MDRRRALLVTTIVALLALFVVDGVKMRRKALRSEKANDFELLWEGGRRVVAGEDVYSVIGAGYVYPPPAYLVFAPFGALPVPAAAIVWHLFKGVLLAGVGVALWRMLGEAGVEQREAALAVTALGVGRALDSELQLGQCNVMVLAMLVGAGWAATRGRDVTAGLLVAAATLFKVSPGLFALYFVWKRRWRVVAGGIAGTVLFGFVLPALAFGPGEATRMYRVFLERMILPSVDGSPMDGDDGWAPGQSLVPVTQRWLSPVQAVSPGRVDDVVTVAVVDLSPEAATAVGKVLVLALLVVMLAFTWPAKDEPRRSRRALLELGLVAAVMLLASPYARKAHFVTLALAFAPAAAVALDLRRRWALAAVGVAALVPTLTAPDLLGKARAAEWTARGPFTLAALLLVAVSCWAIARERRAERAPEEPPALDNS